MTDWMRREEDEFLREDGAPDDGCEYPDASLSYRRRACIHVSIGPLSSPPIPQLITYQSTNSSTVPVPHPGSHHLFHPAAAPLRSASLPHLATYPSLKPCQAVVQCVLSGPRGTSGDRRPWERAGAGKPFICVRMRVWQRDTAVLGVYARPWVKLAGE
jgi:hypothetical protein